MYGKFSERVRQLIAEFDKGQLSLLDLLQQEEQVARDIQAADTAHQRAGMSRRAHDIWQLLRQFAEASASLGEGQGPGQAAAKQGTEAGQATVESSLSAWQAVAVDIEALYASDESAPPLWQDKSQLRKGLRQQVRRLAKALPLGDLRGFAQRVDEYVAKHFRKP